jgi:hypothetical protein
LEDNFVRGKGPSKNEMQEEEEEEEGGGGGEEEGGER